MMAVPTKRTKEHEMTSSTGAGPHLLGSLGSADGKGVVRVTNRVDAAIDDVWSALTDPVQLASWYGEVEGDLRVGGEYRARLFASGWEGTGRVAACEPPRRLLVLTKQAPEADEASVEVTLAADEGQTIVAWEERGMPVAYNAAYGAGIQVHVEDLAAHLAGRDRCDADVRFAELFPAYQDVAAGAG
jgi:uncharacterized protein YndB with AHSA1/START domain